MPQTKNEYARSKSVLTASGLNGKTQYGSVTCAEIVYSGGSQLIKEKQGLVEVGGTLDWGTGTPAF